MHKSLALAALFAALVVPAFAQNEVVVYGAPVYESSGLYLSAKLGGMSGGLKLKNNVDYDFDTLFAGSASAGLRVSDALRLEFEIFGTAGSVSEIGGLKAEGLDVTAAGCGVNLFVNVPLTPNLMIFGGGGIGFLSCELTYKTGNWYLAEYYHSSWWGNDYYSYEAREQKLKEDANYFYYTLGAGLEFLLSPNISFDLSGRYFGTNSSDFGYASSVTLELYGVFAGVTLSF